jgi:RNA polymerase sigma factor (sigma-70 family)
MGKQTKMEKRGPDRILDELLVLRCQEGDSKALNLLARKWQPTLWRYARRQTGEAEAASDIVQDTWLAIIRNLWRLRDPAAFRAWIFGILHRKTADWLRDKQKQRKLKENLSPPAQSRDNENDDGDEIAILRRALRRIAPERRAMLVMYYLDGLSVREIGESLGIPAGTVKSRLFHARAQLKGLVENLLAFENKVQHEKHE